MVLTEVTNNLVQYVFGSRLLFGLGVIIFILIGSIYARIDKSAILLLLSPLVLIMGQMGYIPYLFSIIIFIGIFILWGIMFKLILGKR